MERNNWLLILLVTGLTGTFFVQTVRTPPTTSAVVKTETAKEGQGQAPNAPPSPPRAHLDPLADFLGISTPALDPDPKQPIKPALRDGLKSEVGNLDFLIYLVADPIDAQANYRFDQQIDVLHKAMAADNYVPDRFYLPWKRGDKERLHIHQPGIILFRRNGPSIPRSEIEVNAAALTDLVVVFLVGETATTGIHVEAFNQAVALQQRLQGLVPGSSGISICGPVFSGSGDSLARAIKRLPDGPIPTVITGQAVSINQERFKSLSGGTEIFATVLEGDVLKEALIRHVVDRNSKWNRSRIAWLTETGTGYGASISFHGDRRRPHDVEVRTGAKPHTHSDDMPEVIEFPFPANIAQVRAAYEESRRKDSKTKDGLGGTPLRLSIPFAATDGSAEMAPPQTPDVSAPTAEIILGQILSTIRNQHIKYVGISATDPRDPLFIAAMIKEQCPNVQIMLVTSDVLHLHPDYSRIMHGALIASSYPLYPEALTWCFPYGEHVGSLRDDGDSTGRQPSASRNTVLSSQSSYGVYNALILLRGLQMNRYELDPERSVVQPLASELSGETGDKENRIAWPLSYGAPFQQHNENGKNRFRPSVWVSRIGKSSFHPITAQTKLSAAGVTNRERRQAAYTLALDIEDPESIPERHVHTDVPLSLRLLAVVWIVAGLLYWIILLKSSLLLSLVRWKRAIRSVLKIKLGKWSYPLMVKRRAPASLRGLQLVFRAMGTTSFIVMLSLLGALQWAALHVDGIDWASVAWAPCFLLALILTVMTLANLIDVYWKREPDAPAPSNPRKRKAVWAGAGFFVVLCLVLTRLLRQGIDWNSIGCVVCYLLASVFVIMLASDLVDAFVRGGGSERYKTSLGRRLMIARVSGTALIAILLTSYTWVVTARSFDHSANAYLWYSAAADIWNGLSFLTTIQLPCIAVLILAYGMIVQLHLLSANKAVVLPKLISDQDEKMGDSQAQLRDSLLFPVLSRLHVGKPVVLSGLIIVAVFFWLFFLWSETQGPDFFASTINLPCILWLLATLFWFLRFFKLLHILEDFCNTLKAYSRQIKARWPNWSTMYQEAGVQKNGLEELLWRRDAYSKSDQVRLAQASNPREECALEVDLFVKRMFFHFGRLMAGLIVAGCLMFLAVQSFPLSSEPLLRSTASAMLAATGILIVWYYVKFDRDELLSHLVGTDPKKVAWNWSMIQNVAPGVILAGIGFVSQAFPEVWHWLRHIAEPLARSSS